jgi:diguanylate cyclase (GGDEF)-like protein/PAS domain S-box-containing protein
VKDPCGTNQELVEEISGLQQRIKELEHSESLRKWAEEALESERTLLRNLIDNVPDRIYAKDSEGRFIICNEAMIRRMGKTSMTELVGKSDFDFLPPEMAQRFHADEQAIIQTGIPMINREEPLTTEGGTITRWNLATKVPLLDKHGNRIGIVGVGREITDRKHAEEALRESEQRLHGIVDGSPIPAFVIGKDHRVIHWNKALEEMSRIKSEEIVGTNEQWKAFYNEERPCMADVLMDGAGAAELVPQWYCMYIKSPLIENAYEATDFFPDLGEDGMWLSFTAAAIRDSKGMIVAAIETMKDITDSKRMEAALRESEKRYRELSIVDELSQLYNSRHFYFQLKIELDRSNRYEQPLTLLLLDLDNFKAFNDAYGHVEGDQVLRRLGQVVKRCLRDTDFAFRYGGEEFTILLPMTTSADGAVTAERIRTEFKKEAFPLVPDQDVHMTVSIGLAQYKPQEEMKAFVHRVDQLMYLGKKNGKDRVCSEL